MHPALQPTRTQRLVNRAIDAAAIAFWAFVVLAVIAGIVAGIAL